jgi:hypothetical protein
LHGESIFVLFRHIKTLQMTDQDITGGWRGKYIFGNGYGANLTGRSVSFDVELTCVDGLLSGYCIDEHQRKLVEKPATLEGYVEDDRIFFIKYYPHAIVVDEGGNVLNLPDESSQHIHYMGRADKGQYSGTWETSSLEKALDGTYYEVYGEGTWLMKKKPAHTSGGRWWRGVTRMIKKALGNR